MPAVEESERLRSWLRHEQQSIAAVLATVTHHSFDKVGTVSGVLRNQKTATRTGKGEESEKKYTAKFRKTPPPQAAATVYYPMTDDEGGELSAGVRPAPLEEGRPQGKLERHAGIGYEIVQNFDVPVPQMMEQLPNIVQIFAALSLVPHVVPPRRLCRDTQLAEQLVEVPTKISCHMILVYHSFMAQRTVEQNVDIPAVGGIGTGVGPSGFLPGQSSSVTAEQIVDIPVPHGGRHDLSPSSADFSNPPDTANQVVFRTFSPPEKSAKIPSHSTQRVPRSASSSELSAHQMARAARPQDFSDDGNIFREDEEKIWIRLDTGQWKLLCTDTVVDQPLVMTVEVPQIQFFDGYFLGLVLGQTVDTWSTSVPGCF